MESFVEQPSGYVSLTPQPLTREAFAPFGDVIETEDRDHFTINDGYAERFHNLAEVDLTEADGKPLLSIFRARPRPRPLLVEMMERHPMSSQAFIPLSDTPFLVLVAPAGEAPSPENLTLFRTNGRQGVNFARGVWHYPLLVEKVDQEFLIVDRGGPEKNCDLHYFADGVRGEII
ncbi:ureidoglycolate lyase [Oceanobacter mangrovi]|uniref:ureidoglycolate lyase n=1 Tax=Oceanobacter mangrovi TaxID=2862510 RepID=UPI001C8D0F05|nr:ureidoglycolate lyase [Oceanobacter mangrovi]